MDFIIKSIYLTLANLVFVEKANSIYDHGIKINILMHRIRNLKTFILCARKLSNNVHLRRTDDNDNKDENLGSLLVRIEDALCRNGWKIHVYFLSSGYGFPIEVVDKTRHEIESFEKEIDGWYITSLDYLLQSSSPTRDHEVMEIIDSVLENLADFLYWRHMGKEGLLELIKTLEEKLIFLKNFIRFSTLRGIEQPRLEDLLIQIEAVAVNAAHLSYMCQFIMTDDCQEMQCKISILLQKIKPIDPQVYVTYTQALTSSRLSRRLDDVPLDMADDPINIMKDFIDSLVCNLWEMLQLDTCPVVSMKDQLQVLYEGLRFLRTMLKEQPNKFDEQIRDLTGVVVCDAGVFICSLSQKDVEIDLMLQDLLERIKLIQTEVEENVLKTLTLNFPRTNELGFIDFLLENLTELTSCKSDSNAQSRVQTIQEELFFLRTFMGDIVELRNEHEEVLQALWSRVVEVACRVEFLIDYLVVGDIPDSISTSFDSITEDITNIKTDALKILDGKSQDIKVKRKIRTYSHLQSQSTAPITNEVVGFDDEVTSIVDRLMRGSMQLQIVSIVGMPGIGKTTLATKVYNDPEVTSYFHARAWCSVSQEFNETKVLIELLDHLPKRHIDMNDQDLAEKLRKSLKRRRYLIFLDDVWDIEVWNSLGIALPNDSNGSRIILTSRLLDVAPQAMLDEEPLVLHQLSNDESWELLQKKLSLGNGWPPALYELGMQIAENCKGLPLTIVIVAGLLASMEQEFWKDVLERLSSGIISSTEQCMHSLELSYQHLPDHLKPCLLYFGAIPEDQELSVKRLIRFWIAEGFIPKTKLKSSEDVATDYMMELIGRSLVMVAKQRSNGGVKACRIHDLLHDFCMTKAKEENFFKLLKGYDELLAFNEPCYMRRLCIHSEAKHFEESKIFCPHIRSLLFFAQAEGYEPSRFNISFVFNIFKLLSVLDLGQYHLGFVFPSEIELLLQLKLLAVLGGFASIPSSICNLTKLETFIVHSLGGEVSLPDTLWNLQKLRYLYIRSRYFTTGFTLPIENLDDSSDLYALDRLSGAIISPWDNVEKQMRKFPNIRKLKCKLFSYWDDTENCNKIPAFNFPSLVESLNVSPFHDVVNRMEFEFCFPANLRKLTLSGFWCPWSRISAIGKLPNLEVLKLLDGSFSGEKWDMEEGEFTKLQFLKLSSLDIVRWTGSDDQFSDLQKLVLESCHDLEEIPSCLENISTLEMIEVSDCSDTTASLVKRIQEEFMNMGNSLKILIQSPNLSKSVKAEFGRSDSDSDNDNGRFVC